MKRATPGRGAAALSRRDLARIEKISEEGRTPAQLGRMAKALQASVPAALYSVGQAHRISQLDPRGALVHLVTAHSSIDAALRAVLALTSKGR